MELVYNGIYVVAVMGLLTVALKYFIDGGDDDGLAH